MKPLRLIAILAFVAVCSAIVSAQVPTAGQTAPTSKSSTSSGKTGVVRCVNTNLFRDGILELKQKRDKLNTEFDPKNQQLTAMQNEMNQIENELQKQGDNLTPQTREAKARRLDQLKRDYQYKVQDTNAAAAQRWKDETAQIFDKLDKFFKDYAAKHNITIVIDIGAASQAQVLLYLAPGMDITKEFMDEYNRANPVAANTTGPTGTTPAKP
ncbi:MAG TPA: OmpH family outer membrane protein [Blastocatellia bacterium]|nr:OmpH family outer membrane protein [Blastocatellia bacterium]